MLVEGSDNPLQTMATYIDLNPVRAGLVDDPKDYRFCGYAEAVAGEVQARKGLRKIWPDRKCDIPSELASHQLLMFWKAAADGGQNCSKLSRQDAVEVLEK